MLFFYNIVISYWLVFLAVSVTGRQGAFLKAVVVGLFFISLSSVVIFDGFLNLGSFYAILESDRDEVFGYLSEFGDSLIVLSIILTFIFAILIKKSPKKNGVPNSILWAGLLILLIFPSIYLSDWEDKRVSHDFKENPLIKWSHIYQSSLLNPLFLLWVFLDEQYNLTSARSFEYPKYIYKGKESIYEKIYIIIGESAAAKKFSLNDYKILTTPFFESMGSDSRFFWVKRAISPAPITRDAVTLALTFGTAVDNSKVERYINIIDAAKQSGFQTFWLSSQPKLGFDNSNTSKIAMASEDQIFNSFDHLLPGIVQTKRVPNAKQLFVLHLSGSHASYDNYSVDDLDAMVSAGSNSPRYDATLRKTDRIIKTVYDNMMSDGSKSLLIYTSDHGEVVGKGHGLPYPSKDQYDVPWAVIDSTNHLDDLVTFISTYTRHGIFNTQYTNEVLLYALGYSFEEAPMIDQPHVVHSSGEIFNYFDIDDEYLEVSNEN